jgi:hypothetical protein
MRGSGNSRIHNFSRPDTTWGSTPAGKSQSTPWIETTHPVGRYMFYNGSCLEEEEEGRNKLYLVAHVAVVLHLGHHARYAEQTLHLRCIVVNEPRNCFFHDERHVSVALTRGH